MDAIPEAMAYYLDFYENETMANWGPRMEEQGIEQITFSDEAIAAFEEAAAAPAAEAWIAGANDRGLPGQEIYDFVVGQIGN